MTLGLTDDVAVLPTELARLARARVTACVDSAGANNLTLPNVGRWPGDVERVFACSEFVSNACEQHPELLKDLLESGDLAHARADSDDGAAVIAEFRNSIDRAMGSAESTAEMMPALRRLRRREWVRIAWRDIGGLATLEELRKEGVYERLFASGRKLKDALERMLADARIPAVGGS